MLTKKEKRLDEHSEFFTFRWTTLKALLDNKLVASSFIWILFLPVVMSITERFPSELSIYSSGGDNPLILNLYVPYNWYLLYFSAICFGFARLIYVVLCPGFLRKYSAAAEAISDGVTVITLKDRAAEYLQRFQGKSVHPLSDEGQAIDKLMAAFIGTNTQVKDKFKNPNQTDFDAVIAGAQLMEDMSSRTYVIGFAAGDFDDKLKHKSLHCRFGI